jgi:hypothetical protein
MEHDLNYQLLKKTFEFAKMVVKIKDQDRIEEIIELYDRGKGGVNEVSQFENIMKKYHIHIIKKNK